MPSDGKGFGLTQITNPAPTQDQIWNWRSNIDGGVGIFANKFDAVASYVGQNGDAANSATYITLANAWRAAHQKPPNYPVYPAAYTVDQTVLDAVRGFNGFQGSGTAGQYPKLGINLHEFTVALQSGLMVATDLGNHAESAWAEIPPASRGQDIKLANYVINVENSPSP